ncbi:hypothetical protein ACOTDF_13210 [Achromobacter insuavis]|uniref:hypothetical protein n=1 Tax=Achromobacter insuavis TaxID=1287735 RepID=UPI003B9A06C2
MYNHQMGTDHVMRECQASLVWKAVKKKVSGYSFAILIALVLIIAIYHDKQSWVLIFSALSIPIMFIVLISAYLDKDSGSVKISLVWGILGVCMLLFGVYADNEIINKNFTNIIINLSGTLISLSVIGIVFQLKDTKEYFATTLSDLIMKESYVEKLSRPQLEKLQKTVLERYFQNSSDLNRENSFYRYFSDNLQKFIGSPYRENYVNTVALQYGHGSDTDSTKERSYQVQDDLSYRLRSMGPELQNDIRWKASKDEIEELLNFSIHLGDICIYSWPSNEEQDSASEWIDCNFSSKHPEDGLAVKIQLSEMAKNRPDIRAIYLDGAIVKISAKYLVTKFNSITTKLLFPTKGFSLSVFHPTDVRCKVESYGIDIEARLIDHNKASQGFFFHYADWMLPNSGVYVSIEPIEKVGERSNGKENDLGEPNSKEPRQDENGQSA